MNSMREIQVHISDVLNEWADIMLDIEAHEKAHLLHYQDKDLMNAMHIFLHVLQNVGIHNKTINDVDIATEMGKKIHEYVKKYAGVDTKKFYHNDK